MYPRSVIGADFGDDVDLAVAVQAQVQCLRGCQVVAEHRPLHPGAALIPVPVIEVGFQDHLGVALLGLDEPSARIGVGGHDDVAGGDG